MTHFADFGDPAWLMASSISTQFPLSYPHVEQIREVIVAFEDIGYVAGGAARYLLVPDAPEPADIDVFLYQQTMNVQPLIDLGYELAGNPNSRAPFFTSPGGDKELRVQVIRPDPNSTRRAFGTPLEVLKSFTFHTEQAAIWYEADGAVGLISVAGRAATEDRVLTNNRISNPVLSLFRLNKYGRKGYSVSMMSLQEITDALRKLTPDEYDAALQDARSMISTPDETHIIPIPSLEGNDDLPF